MKAYVHESPGHARWQYEPADPEIFSPEMLVEMAYILTTLGRMFDGLTELQSPETRAFFLTNIREGIEGIAPVLTAVHTVYREREATDPPSAEPH